MDIDKISKKPVSSIELTEKRSTRPVSPHVLLSLLQEMPQIDEEGFVVSPKNLSVEQARFKAFKEAVLLLMKLTQQLENYHVDLSRVKNDLDSNQAKALLEMTLLVSQSIIDNAKECAKQMEDAKKSQSLMEVFSWIIGVTTALITVFTAGIAAAVLSAVLTVCSLVKINPEGETLISSLEKELSKSMPEWASKIVVFAIVLVASVAASAGSAGSAAGAAATGAEEAASAEGSAASSEASSTVLNKLLKNIFLDVLQAASVSDVFSAIVDGIASAIQGAEGKDGIDQTLLAYIKIAVTILMTVILIALSFSRGSSNGLTNAGKKLGELLGQGLKMHPEAAARMAENTLKIIETVASIGQGVAGIQKGVSLLNASSSTEVTASLKLSQQLMDMLAKMFHSLLDNDTKNVSQLLEQVETMIKDALQGSELLNAAAQMLRRAG